MVTKTPSAAAEQGSNEPEHGQLPDPRAPRNSYISTRSFASVRTFGAEIERRRWLNLGHNLPRQDSTAFSSFTQGRWTSRKSMTLHDEYDMDEDKKRQFSESSQGSGSTSPVNERDLKHRDIETASTIGAPSMRSSLESLPWFETLPVIRLKRRSSIWTTERAEMIPLGTEDDVTPTPGTPKLPEQSSGMSAWHEYIFVFTVCLAQIFSLAALAQSFAPLLIIADFFGVKDPGQMSWWSSAYSMTLGTFILPAGRLGDMFGHKKLFCLGWIWFAAWSVVCGFSYVGGPIMLSACRGMQGIGPAVLVPNGIALLARTFPIGMKRSVSIAVFGGCGPVGVTLGVAFSAALAQLVWWPWCFWVMAAACIAAGILAYFAIPPDSSRTSPSEADATSRERFDMLGSVTGVSGLILINFALNQAPLVGWDIVYIPTLLVVGFLLMGAFVYIELKVASRPIVPLRGLHRDAAFTLVCIACGWASHGIWSYYLYLFIEVVRGHSALIAAAQTWPVAPIGFCAALIVPFLLRKVRVPFLMSAAMLFFFIGTILLVFAPAEQSYWLNTFVSILIMPFAMNWSFPSGTILMSNAVAKQHQGIAASLISTMVNYSIATGLGIAGTIDRYTSPKAGILGGYRATWWFGIALSLLGFVISLYFIWQSRARR